MTMIEAAEQVSEHYKISRAAQDAYALQSQRRTAQAQAEGRFRTRSCRCRRWYVSVMRRRP